MLDVMFPLNSVADVVEPFEIDQSFQSITLGKAFDKSRAMFKYSADKIVRHSNVQYAVWTIGQNINVSTRHAGILQDVEAGTSPAMTN